MSIELRRSGISERLPRKCTRSEIDRKSTRLNSSHDQISYAVFCLKKKKKKKQFKSNRQTNNGHHRNTNHALHASSDKTKYRTVVAQQRMINMSQIQHQLQLREIH